MALTLDGIATAFNGNYFQLSNARAQVSHLAGDRYEAQHLGQTVEFEVLSSASNMALIELLRPSAAQLWTKARR